MSTKFMIGNRYYNTCWFTGGTTFYTCVDRTESEVRFSPVYHEIDGTHKGETETFPLHLTKDGTEYIVTQTYRGEENRMCADR